MADYGCAEPPAKKRRFFTDDDDDDDDNIAIVNAQPTRGPPNQLAMPPHVASTSHNSASTSQQSQPPGFDEATFISLVGENISPDIIRIIQTNCGSNLERAINMYFDGTWKNFRRHSPVKVSPLTSRPINPSSRITSSTNSIPATIPVSKVPPGQRYIGAFGVEGWATRSGANLLKHGDTVRIERQKIQVPIRGKSNTTISLATMSKPSLAASKRIDVIVRFTDTKGSEIGRLAKDTANWVSTLIDQNVCVFEGTCVYAPERLRTNDTVFMQLRCCILKSAFEGSGFKPTDNRSTGMFEEKETNEERDLRLRQVALVRMFHEINLLPSRSTEAAAKHGRKGLLEAAEMAESSTAESKAGVSTAGAPGTSDGSSQPLEEAEDGTELEQDQLDALYKKAQSFDFDTPQAEPADSFAMTLRPYQKQ